MARRSSESHASAWKQFVSAQRLRPTRVTYKSEEDARTPFENDLDRVVFSSSFRRLRNKAQVFSLEPHDFVRTRLTHSIEVSTIGRSLGEGVTKRLLKKYPHWKFLILGDIGTIVATACLLHDLGNPPFGHFGEKAIGWWFDAKIGPDRKFEKILDAQERGDLKQFEGNAQAFRIATRLQWTGQAYGMNLTAATLSALIKYPCGSHEVQGKGPKSLKKFGYLKADSLTFQRVRKETGLDGYLRNPLTYLMEAADDIAYATGDIEDVLKKGLVDYRTIREALESVKAAESRECVEKFLDKPYKTEFKDIKGSERPQLAIQRFCQMARGKMAKSAIQAFIDSFGGIMSGDFCGDLIEVMSMSDLCAALKGIMTGHVYPHIEIAHREGHRRSSLNNHRGANPAAPWDARHVHVSTGTQA